MKLAAIYNTWDGIELLDRSVQQIYPFVETVFIVYQDVSNSGEKWSPLKEIEWMAGLEKVVFVKFEPNHNLSAISNEANKRNLGLSFAKQNKCTHFLNIDNDEFYEDFGVCKKLYIESGHSGSVCRMHTYFKKPTLRFDEPENYYVPFIHKINEFTQCGGLDYYKFYVDPTRKVNEPDVVELPIFMHHYSWVRKDIMRKIRNSSAPIQQNSIAIEDYHEAEEGYFLRNWQRTLISVPDKFDLERIFS